VAFGSGKRAEPSDIWRETLVEGRHPGPKMLRKVMRHLPGMPRCKVCQNPFGGWGGRVCRAVGFAPSRKNPQLCALCCEKLPIGGAEVETAILFADVRGSTALAERLGPVAYAETMNRFYRVATNVLMRHDATIDKLIGDEVMAFFVPGLSGPQFKDAALRAGQDLLRELGYGNTEGPWLSVGIGIDSGIAFVGNVGTAGYVDFTALGDPVNMAAHIQEAAEPGELLLGETVYATVANRYPNCPARDISLRGTDRSLRVRSLPLAGAARVGAGGPPP
jgi:adenylate cyclase